MRALRRWSRALAPAVLWAALLLWLGGAQVAAPSTDLPLDKAAHVVIYGVLGVLLGRGAARAGAGRVAMLLLLAAGLAVGAIDELHQASVAGRSSEPADFLADTVGLLLGFVPGRRAWRRGDGSIELENTGA